MTKGYFNFHEAEKNISLPAVSMLCDRCNGLNFQPLLTQDKKSGFYILHRSRASYSRSLSERCALCTLINSQLGQTELEDDVCAQLRAFLVLKRRWPPASSATVAVKSSPVIILSRLGSGALTVVNAFPARHLVPQVESVKCDQRKRKRGLAESADAPRLIRHQNTNALEVSVPQPALPDHTGSMANMALARQWIQDCLQNHDTCAIGRSKGHATYLPTRLVNVQDPEHPFLQTAVDALGSEYVAFSYAWGHGGRFVSTKNNFIVHKHRIPLKPLPRSFAEAFQTTRMLGYRYIWIDALCIIQDDDDDKQRELPRMGDIYQHAVFTIFAEGAPGAFAGIFQERDSCSYRPCTVNATMNTKNGVISEQLTLGTIVTGPNYLKARGWVLQEEILSSRCLSFGRQICWKCTLSEASETRPSPHPRKTALTEGRATCEDKLRLWLYAPAQMHDTPRKNWFRWNQYDAWYSVIEEYSTKDLTDESDQLPALSGLADLFQRAHRSKYLAGLWREDLQLGLAWYIASNESRPVRKYQEQEPSWSWASVGMVRLKFRCWKANSTHVVSEGAVILDASCTPKNLSNPYGYAVEGILKLRTRMKKVKLQYSIKYVKDRTEFSFGNYSGPSSASMTKGEHPRFPALVFDSASAQFVGEAALDRPIIAGTGTGVEHADASGVSDPIVGNYEIEAWCALLHVQKSSNRCRSTALILDQYQPELKIYRRLGLLFLGDRRLDDNLFSDWRSDKIEIR
ncbi:heterokaryon incompatibility protein-domain-containing protein [Xylariaceae sp. FL1651]|nr:heterokaryon incompatibility protein-domain-containing protein [Xylariaceae sp. FL1651]